MKVDFEKPAVVPTLFLKSDIDIVMSQYCCASGIRTIERLMGTEEWRAVVRGFMTPNCPNQREKPDGLSAPDWNFDELPDDQKELCTEVDYGSDEFWKYVMT